CPPWSSASPAASTARPATLPLHDARPISQAHPALGDLAVLLPRLLLGLALVLEGAAGLLQALRHLAPDPLELPFDQGRRQSEAVPVLKLVQQRTLHLGAGGLIVLSLDLLGHELAKLLQVLGPQVLGELVIDLGPLRSRDLRHFDVEGRLLARQRLLRVLLRERHRDRALLAGLDVLELLLEAGDEAALAEHHVDAFARAAFE